MAVFYQQSGKAGEADFPKTLVHKDNSLRFFTADTLRTEFAVEVPADSISLVEGTNGFQIWGVPAGARDVIRPMCSGDLVLLIGYLSKHSLEDGRFFYAGRVCYVVPGEDYAFSRKLWGDRGFPLIFFMQGALIEYSWQQFADDFRFHPNYFIAGHIRKIPQQRLINSIFRGEAALANRLGIDVASLMRTHRC